ncbi:BA14K family protein, partial [Rhizobium ruizarguesonis]
MKRLAIVTLSLVTALTSVPPAMAFPNVAMPKIEAAEAQPVQYRHH